jgi:predicted CXXCH cytochrome family protein
MMTLLAAGCSPEVRYRTLSFFFDGVPPPAGSTPGAFAGKGPGSSQKDAAGKPRPSSHGPYAARLCDACHQRVGSNKLILPVEALCLNCHELNIQKKHIHGPLASGGCRVCHEPHGSGKPLLLVAEPNKFCFYCHDETEVGTRAAHKESGGVECTVCHDAHSSNSEFLLK